MADRPDEMEQVRAARAYLDSRGRKDEQIELDAFMAIFHPEHERIVLDPKEATDG